MGNGFTCSATQEVAYHYTLLAAGGFFSLCVTDGHGDDATFENFTDDAALANTYLGLTRMYQVSPEHLRDVWEDLYR